MTKSEMLDLIKLLCALEAAGVISYKLPDYLSDRVTDAITLLSTKLLEATNDRPSRTI